MPPPNNTYHEANRLSWNAATQQHHTHKPDLIERYKNGHNNLYPEEIELLGDVKGKSLVHLQCNDGQDTLSIARHLGSVTTGVDISDSAIQFARTLATETNTPVEFIRADIFDWFEQNTAPFDVVFTSYGALYWISEIARWGQGIAKTLKPGGKFVMIEFHPLMTMFEIDWSLKYNYMGGQATEVPGVGDYVGDDFAGKFQNPYKAFGFEWGIAEVVTALLDAGLTLTHLKEYPYCNGWKPFPDVRNEAGNRNYPPADKPTIAMMFSIVAYKPE